PSYRLLEHFFQKQSDFVKLLKLYSRRGIFVCSGDKTLELAISTGLLPLYIAPRWKSQVKENLSTLSASLVLCYSLLINHLNDPGLIKFAAPLIDTDLINQFHLHLRPHFLTNSFNKVIENEIIPNCLRIFQLEAIPPVDNQFMLFNPSYQG